MNFLDIAIAIFILLELSNVLIIYFKPDFKHGNSLSTFKQWNISQNDENTRLFVNYMANWVAGSKLVFIALLLVILFAGEENTKVWSIIAIIPAIMTYYFKLHPIISKMDKQNEISPKGYSKTLCAMITGFIFLFFLALLLHFLI